MPAVTQVPEFFPTEFGTNWEHLVQQKLAKLKEYVSVDTVRGKEKSYNQVGPVEMSRVLVRAGDTTITDTPLAKRWLRPFPHEKGDLLDEWDSEYLGEIALPQSEILQAHAAAYARTCDRLIVEAAVGTAYTGETGTTATVLPSAQKVGVDYVESGSPATSGLTIAKLRAAKFILDDGEVDDEDPRIIALSAKQLQDLLRTTEVTSADYNTVKALVAGQIDTFLGFKFRRVSKSFFATASGGLRYIVAYAKSGIKLTDSGRKSYVDIRADKSHALQLRTVASIGATRMEEAKVVEIACDEVL
jgi:hypothetical protein